MNDPQPDPAALLRHTAWVRALARRLVADAALADDLVQDTFAAALQGGPDDERRLGAWLRRVLRNRAREHARAGHARRDRESVGARHEALAGADEVAEKVETQRRLAARLLALEEPYRATLLLRFYEDLPPRAIAARHGVPVATVKSRLHRGLERLRSDLDREHGGDRRGWVLALAPWAGDTRVAVAAGAPAGLSASALAVLALVGVSATVGAWWWRGTAAPAPAAVRPPSVQVSQRDERTALRDEDVELASGAGAAARTAAEAPAATAPERATAAEEPREVRGRVLDPDGRPRAGLALRARGGSSIRSGAGGSFRFETRAARERIEVAEPGWTTVRAGAWAVDGALEPVVVAAPAVSVEGEVVDGLGGPVPGAAVSLAAPADFRARFTEALDASFEQTWQVTADAAGRFALADLPALAGATLRAVHPRAGATSIEAPRASTAGLRLQLVASVPAAGRGLDGVVLRADGDPARDACIALGLATAWADERGRFTLDLDRAGEDASRLVALEAGALPAILERPDGGWPSSVQLVLGDAPLAIRGQVVDQDGTPRAGGRVWIADPTRFGAVGHMPVQLEALLAGGQLPREVVESAADPEPAPEGDGYGSARPAGAPDALLHWVQTDAEGRFTLGGLLDREYTLCVLDRGLHWGAVRPGVRAGSTILFEVDDAEAHEVLRGRVITDAGDAVAGVELTPFVSALNVRGAVPGGEAHVTRYFLGESVTTDALGEFTLRGVPRAGISFHLVADSIVPSYASVDDVLDPERFEIRVLARAHLVVHVPPGPDAPDAFRAVDAAGEPLALLEMRADGYSHLASAPLVDGVSGVVTVTTDARAVELLRAGVVVARLPIAPRPGETLHLRP